MTALSPIREPAVAGMFYPADADRLGQDVDAMLAAAPTPPCGARPLMLVSPHAGYPYSGAVAAGGFRWMRDHPIRTVVMIGPSHVEHFDFTSVWAGEAYETPLGRVPVATDMARRLAAHAPSIRESNHGHVQPRGSRGEHGLEVQLPFLQRVHPDATFVPVVMGDQRWEHCVALGDALAAECGPEDLILASSDLSHFYDGERADELDTVFLDTLSTMDPEAVYRAVSEGRCEACGAGPVVASLIATASTRNRHYELLARCNSGDVTGDRTSVVGYASAVVHA
jgi:AmmeMemoRadiSam system protein B